MIYVFEDGRIIYDENIMTQSLKAQAIAAESLPSIPEVEGKVGHIRGNLSKGVLEIWYADKPSEIAQEVAPTEQEVFQAEILLGQAEIIEKQKFIEEVLAQLLINQMGV